MASLSLLSWLTEQALYVFVWPFILRIALLNHCTTVVFAPKDVLWILDATVSQNTAMTAMTNGGAVFSQFFESSQTFFLGRSEPR